MATVMKGLRTPRGDREGGGGLGSAGKENGKPERDGEKRSESRRVLVFLPSRANQPC